MNISQLISYLQDASSQREHIAGVASRPGSKANYSDFPADLNPALQKALVERGLKSLYSHQRMAYDTWRAGEHFVITTPTASGKSLAYLLPVLQDKLENPSGRYLFLFPTKALAQDQMMALREILSSLPDLGWNVNTFDGDTPPDERRIARSSGDFILSNPDMLHAGILPNHSGWKSFFENLRMVVVDEMHTYIGVFGSHVANVFCRMNRILRNYGSSPRYFLSSATIANPGELAANLVGDEVRIIDESGAPQGDRTILIYNPPVIDGIGNRQSPYRFTAALGSELLRNKVASIFFTRSRTRTEILATMLREKCGGSLAQKIKAYRGGYLPIERRVIEKGLRDGDILGVVSTNALELGIDIGTLQAAVTVGYPGKMNSIAQQFGRAGRRLEPSLAIMIATVAPIDQYITAHPDILVSGKSESGIVHPENLLIYSDHIKCAAYELPFEEGDKFGNQIVDDYMQYLEENRVVFRRDGRWYWGEQTYPANSVSLRSAAQDDFVIVDMTEKSKERVIGRVDLFSAPTLIHTEAIYIHQGEHYYVDNLDWDRRRAEVSSVDSDYFTDASAKVDISILQTDEVRPGDSVCRWMGELSMTTQAVLYKKIKIATQENLGWGNIDTPPITMHTQGAWLSFPESLIRIADGKGIVLKRLAETLKSIAPLIALCDPRDLYSDGYHRDEEFATMAATRQMDHQCAVVFLDRYPGGVGLSYKLIANPEALLQLAKERITECSCKEGCPSCIGLADVLPDEPVNLKAETLDLVGRLLEKIRHPSK